MKSLKLNRRLFTFLAIAVTACIPVGEYPGSDEDLFHVYLTWAKDATDTSITINYHHTKKEFSNAQAYYDTVSHGGDPSKYTFHAMGKTKTQEHLKRKVEVVTLEGLSPDTTYYFVVGDETSGFSEEKKFKTLPGGNAPLHFVQGGDMGTGPSTDAILKQSAKLDPDFVVIGGDVAYADKPDQFVKWDHWLKSWSKEMITSDGRLIPMLLAIGNHEVDSFLFLKKSYFYEFLFEQNGNTYFDRHFGDHTYFMVLDTGHVASYSGKQKDWMKKALKANKNIHNKLAVYHIPLYPSHRDYNLPDAKKGRKHWAPIFDQYGLTAAFENHDHSQKRTKRLFNNEANEDKGTIYFGDGCYGKASRDVDPSRWYLESTSSTVHFWNVHTSGAGLEAEAIDIDGKVFDHTTIE